MKTVVAVVLACLAPRLALAASLTGTNVVSSATVNLSAVGTLDSARWPGYVPTGTALSDVTTTGVFKTYSNDPRLIGDRRGIKVAGPGASFAFTVEASTVERTLTYYIGGWSSTGRVTVTLPGASTYTTAFSSAGTFSRVITLKFRADAPATLQVNYTQTAGPGSINMQAAALAQAAVSPQLTLQPGHASLTGASVVSQTSVNLSAVGTLDWARWPGYSRKGTAISDVTTTGTFKTYSNDPRLIGDRRGIKVAGPGASFTFTVAASTVERTLTYYIGGWNATGRVTATLPGAATYTTTFSSASTFSRVITLKFRAGAAATLTVTYTQTAGPGSINMQAAALSQTGASAQLTWQPPAANSDGSPLTDLAAFKVYWGTAAGEYTHSTRISNAAARAYTVTGLASGTWYFVVTALNSAGMESPHSNVWSKTVP